MSVNVKVFSLSAILKTVIILCLCIHTGWAIMCHNCSSKSDTNCADPFDLTANKGLLIDCSDVRPDAKFCRKIDQTVHGIQRVIRRCAWEEHKKYDCYFGTSQYYKSQVCICDKDGCNGASFNAHSWTFIAVMATLATITLF